MKRAKMQRTPLILVLCACFGLVTACASGPKPAPEKATPTPSVKKDAGTKKSVKKKTRRVRKKAVKKDKSPRPGRSMATRVKKARASETEASIRVSIENQEQILELEEPDRNSPTSDYPKMLIALADFYWDLAMVYEKKSGSHSLEQAIYDAEEEKNHTKIAKLRGQQQALLDKQHEYQEKTLAAYRRVLKEFSGSKKVTSDEITYYLAYHLTMMGKQLMERGAKLQSQLDLQFEDDKKKSSHPIYKAGVKKSLSLKRLGLARITDGVAVYQQVILNFSNSEFVPDALVNIGEYYFAQNKYEDALKLYEKAETYTKNPISGFAKYKSGWCHYNLSQYKLAMTKFLRVIKVAQAQQKRGIKSAFGLEEDAAKDLKLPYSKIGKPSAAIAFFKKYTPKRYLTVCGQVADLYKEQEKYEESIQLLRDLIKEARKTQGGLKKRYLVLRFQRIIVDNLHRKGKEKVATVAELKELARLYVVEMKGAPLRFVRQESKQVDNLIWKVANDYHQEYRSLKVEKTLALTTELYDLYLKLFPDKPNAYEIHWNTALLMKRVKKYSEAAQAFERIITMKPDGRHANDAAEFAVICYLKSASSEDKGVKNENVADLSARELSASGRRFIAAVDRWLQIVRKKDEACVTQTRCEGKKSGCERIDGKCQSKMVPESRANLPNALFLAAKQYYNANQFKAAATRFAKVVDRFLGEDIANRAALYVLSSYSLSRDIDNLRKYADYYDSKDQLKGAEVVAIIKKIRSQSDFLKCFKFEKKEAFLGAAKCFQKYSEDHSTSEKAPVAVYNAATNFFRAKQVTKSLAMQEKLYKDFRKHELAPKALFAVGDIFRSTGWFDRAATFFDMFFKNHPDHPLAEKALQYASVYWKTLGQSDKAVKDLNLYLNKFKKAKARPRIHLDIIKIRLGQKKAKKVLKAGKKHLKMFPKEGPATRLQVLGAMGKAWRLLYNARESRKTFGSIITYYSKLGADAKKSLGLEGVAPVAEAQFYIGSGLLREARKLKMTGKNQAKVIDAIKQRFKLVMQARRAYKKVVQFGHPGWAIAAMTTFGKAALELADGIENVPVPKALRKNDEIAEQFRMKLEEQSRGPRAMALRSYKSALTIARENSWFNKYSERAEVAVARMDLTDRSVKEFRTRPDRGGPNRGTPDFKAEVK